MFFQKNQTSALTMALIHKTQYAFICIHLCLVQEQSSQQHRTSGRLAKIFPFMPRATFLACGIFHPHIISPHFMFESKEEKKAPSSFNNSSNINSPGETTKAGEHREEMFIHAQEQPRKPTDERTENKQIPPCPAHPPPPAANRPGLCVNLEQVPKLCPGSHPGVFVPRDSRMVQAAMPCCLLCQCSTGLAANGHSPSAPGCSCSQVILFLSLRTFHFSLLLSKGFIPLHREEVPWIWSSSHQGTTSLLTPIPRWQADPSLTPLHPSTGKG